MMRFVEAEIGMDGQVRLKETIRVSHACPAVVIIAEEPCVGESALLSEPSLARDWNRPEEDAAWSHLQQAR